MTLERVNDPMSYRRRVAAVVVGSSLRAILMRAAVIRICATEYHNRWGLQVGGDAAVRRGRACHCG